MTVKKEVNNMIGQKFGRLTVLSETNLRRKDELNISYHILWKRHKRGWSDKECLLGRDV